MFSCVVALQVWIEHAKFLYRRALASRNKAKAIAAAAAADKNKGKGKSGKKAKAEKEAASAASAASLKSARGLLPRALGCLPKHKVSMRFTANAWLCVPPPWLIG